MRDKCEDDAFLIPFPYCGLGLLSLVLLRWVDDVEASDSYHFWFLNTRKRDFEKEKNSKCARGAHVLGENVKV